MSNFHYTNNAQSKLAAEVAMGATQLSVSAGEGDRFPSEFPFRVTIWDSDNHHNPGEDPAHEIVEVTGRTGDVLDITRAKEGTADSAHTSGHTVALLVTAGTFEDPTHGINPRINSHISSTDAHHTKTTSLSEITDSGTLAAKDSVQVGDLDAEASTSGQAILSNGDGTASWSDITSPDDTLLLILSMM